MRIRALVNILVIVLACVVTLVLLLAAFVGFSALSSRPSSAATKPQTTARPAEFHAPPAGPASLAAARHEPFRGVVVASFPASDQASPQRAAAKVRELQEHGFDAFYQYSNLWPSLKPGEYLVVSGGGLDARSASAELKLAKAAGYAAAGVEIFEQTSQESAAAPQTYVPKRGAVERTRMLDAARVYLNFKGQFVVHEMYARGNRVAMQVEGYPAGTTDLVAVLAERTSSGLWKPVYGFTGIYDDAVLSKTYKGDVKSLLDDDSFLASADPWRSPEAAEARATSDEVASRRSDASITATRYGSPITLDMSELTPLGGNRFETYYDGATTYLTRLSDGSFYGTIDGRNVALYTGVGGTLYGWIGRDSVYLSQGPSDSTHGWIGQTDINLYSGYGGSTYGNIGSANVNLYQGYGGSSYGSIGDANVQLHKGVDGSTYGWIAGQWVYYP